MKLKIEGVSKRELLTKLTLYSALYGFLAINYIDLVVPGSEVRGLNAYINIAHRVMSSMGWGRREPPRTSRCGDRREAYSEHWKLPTEVGSSSLTKISLFLLPLLS